ncbi:MAG: hypothetical protein M0Z52_12005 [Actinomycetota bacterium]|nr:hypothetical protein [Nitrospiraceae bacterium]MDA8157152.1 hypothetical protein [Actinomycetota bacterium]
MSEWFEGQIIPNSGQYKSYTGRLKRAKIIALVKSKKLLDNFCASVWQYGFSNKGKNHINFLEKLADRFKSSKIA